jgi:type IV fimbrial biogenesis protein FimT
MDLSNSEVSASQAIRQPSFAVACRPREACRGFSTLELVIGLAVAAIAVTLATPSLTNMVKNSRLTATTNALVTAFNYARTEAINRNANMTVVSNNGSDWSQGWEVQDQDGNMLRSFAPVRSDVTMDSNGAIGAFTFGSGGRLIPSTDSISICDDRVGETGRTLAVGVRGRIAVSDLQCE